MGNAASSAKDKKKKLKDTNRAEQLPALKIVIVGERNVGKSSLLVRYVHNQFTPIYTPTKKVVIENIVKKLNIPDHALVSLTFWDLPGKEDFDQYQSYFTNVDAAIVVVDLSDTESLKMALVWKQILLNNMTMTTYTDDTPGVKRSDEIYKREPLPDKYSVPLLLVGTKLDIVEEELRNMEKSASDETSPEDQTNSNTTEEKLQCIRDLEEYGAKYSFTGSVCVSARDGNGSVHQGIQSFIRHIIEKKYRPRKRDQDSTPSKNGKKQKQDRLFEICEVSKIDKEFERAEKCVRRIQSLSKYSEETLEKFFTKCSQANLIDDDEMSLESSIIALKKYFCSPDTHLEIKEEDDFCTLHVESDNDNLKMAACYEKIFKLFNLEYSASVKAILKEFPDLNTTLGNIDHRVEQLCEEVPSPEQDVIDDYKKSSLIIEKNRARLKLTQNQSVNKLKSIKSNLQKIQTALLW